MSTLASHSYTQVPADCVCWCCMCAHVCCWLRLFIFCKFESDEASLAPRFSTFALSKYFPTSTFPNDFCTSTLATISRNLLWSDGLHLPVPFVYLFV